LSLIFKFDFIICQTQQFDFDSTSFVIRNAPIKVDDAPRFPHRGLMIDTSRHFLPLPAIYSIIDSLPFAKINVLRASQLFHQPCLTDS
jgi:hexosaminidase